MASEATASIAAAACFMVAALACARSEDAGYWLGAAGAAFLAASLVARGLGARYWPLYTLYEFALAFALGTALSAIVIGRAKGRLVPGVQTPIIRAAAMTFCTALIVYARLGMSPASRGVRPPPPAVDSIWLPLQVGMMVLSYGALAMAGLGGVIWLLRDSGQIDTCDSGDVDAAGSLVGRQPEHSDTTSSSGPDGLWLLGQALLVGYPLLTLSLVLRAVEAWTGWGRPWSWDSKDVSILLTWVFYTACGCALSGWPFRRRAVRCGQLIAWLALIGLGCLLSSLLRVDWLVRWMGREAL